MKKEDFQCVFNFSDGVQMSIISHSAQARAGNTKNFLKKGTGLGGGALPNTSPSKTLIFSRPSNVSGQSLKEKSPFLKKGTGPGGGVLPNTVSETQAQQQSPKNPRI